MNRSRKLATMMLSAILVLALALTANAMGMGGSGGSSGMGGSSSSSGMGSGMGGSATTTANSFSGFGTVSAVDTTANTITVDLTMASRLLKSDVGTTVIFQVTTSTYIGSMVAGGMMSQSGASASSMIGGGTQLKLSDIKVGDQVAYMGTYDSTAKQYDLTRLLDWVY